MKVTFLNTNKKITEAGPKTIGCRNISNVIKTNNKKGTTPVAHSVKIFAI
jgi:hypothetical protein